MTKKLLLRCGLFFLAGFFCAGLVYGKDFGVLGLNTTQLKSRVAQIGIKQKVRINNYDKGNRPSECKAGKKIASFDHSVTKVELLFDWETRSKISKAEFYFKKPVSLDIAIKELEKFIPKDFFSKAHQKTFGEEEGNECTLGNGGVLYQSVDLELWLYHDKKGSPKITEAFFTQKTS